MAGNAIIFVHFGTNAARISLLAEAVARMRCQHGDNAVYLVENILPGDASPLPAHVISGVRHLRVTGNPVIWQKEAMYNAGAAAALRDGADNLVFIDSDVVPENDAWVLKLELALERFDWVHGGRQIVYLCDRATRELLAAHDRTAIEARCATDRTCFDFITWSSVFLRQQGINGSGFPGGAWAVTRTAWLRYGGWDCSNIVGGGDLLHCHRLLREYENSEYQEIGNLRAVLFDEVLHACIRRDPPWRVGYLHYTLFHLWHGRITGRKYLYRYGALVRPEFRHLFRRRQPQFARDQVIAPAALVRTNGDGLLDFTGADDACRAAFLAMAEYHVARGDLGVTTLNRYLDCCRADFRCAAEQRFALRKLRWETRLCLVPRGHA